MPDPANKTVGNRGVPSLSLRASMQPGSVNEEARTVEVVWTTGAKVLRTDWDGQFYEELSLDPKHVRLDRLNNGAPFLANHDSYRLDSVVGVVVPGSARLQGSEGRATIRFARAEDDAEADKIFRKVRDGIIQNISVGYRIHKMEKVEGGEAKVPTFRATDWQPFEISAVPMGADDGAGFRSFLEPRGTPQTESNTMTPEEIAAAKAAADKKIADEQRAVELKAAADVAVAAERTRVAGVQHVVKSLGLGEDFAKRAVDGNMSLDAVRAAAVDELAKRTAESPTDNKVHVEITDDNQDKFVRGVSAAMFERSGTSQLIEDAKAKVEKKGDKKTFALVSTDAGEFRGMGFEAAARACLSRRGVAHSHIYDRARVIAMALAQRAYGGTSDFAVLLENVMYKQLRAAYAIQPSTWERWCGTDEVADFRDSHRFGLGSFGTLDLKPENAEYKAKAIPDGAKKTIQTQTYGNKIGLSREMLINDDMGAMANVATAFGESAGKSIENACYAMINDNSGLGPYWDGTSVTGATPFFDNTAYANVSTGAALSAAALDLDRQKMRQQLDLSGNDYLDLVPSIILVNPALEGALKILNSDSYDPAQTGQKSNIAKGMFSDIVTSPRLGTGTKRYLFTASKEAFKVVFLAGQGRGPVMDTKEGFNTDGIEWKARIEFKVCPFDEKQAVYNAGT